MAHTRETEEEIAARPRKCGVPSRANRELYKVLPVRLPIDKWELMSQEADALGIGTCTLARIWILDSLRKINNGNGNNGKSPKR